MLVSVSTGHGRWWAWEDLNLRPHQQMQGTLWRRSFPQGRATVGAKLSVQSVRRYAFIILA
jgi:hypothetical protein